MNEEEKQAYDYLEKYIQWETFGERNLEGDIKTILNLVDKQQTEIENRLNEIKDLYNFISIREERLDKLAEINEKYNDLYISKDKIKEKIEEITSYAYTSAEERDCQDYAIQILRELLGE